MTLASSILIVEDDPKTADLIDRFLTKEGYRTAHAADGRAAIDTFATFGPDLVILDAMLPKVDGFEVCANIRRTSKVPILFLTARTEEADLVLGSYRSRTRLSFFGLGRTMNVPMKLLWKLLSINSMAILIVILTIGLAVHLRAATYFTTLTKQYNIAPADAHAMFLQAVDRYLLMAKASPVLYSRHC